MIRNIMEEMRAALVMTASLVLLLCGAYPVTVFIVAQGFFPAKANGSIVYREGTAAGSMLIGQRFQRPEYFHPRPSAAGEGYDAVASGGSNLGPTSQRLMTTAKERVRRYRAENGLSETVPVPADAVMASASGLDPDISVGNAMLQVPRVAKARGWPVERVIMLVRAQTEGRTLGFMGQPRVNVLMLNLWLDRNEDGTMTGNG